LHAAFMYFPRLFATLATVATIVALAGCSTFTLPAPSADTTTRSPRIYQPKIEMSGRMSAQYEANYRDQSISVHFTWSQSPDQTVISLASPTGQTMATIQINAQGATLNQPGKPPRQAADINELTIDMLGWPLPVAGLRDWLQGFLDATHQPALTEASTLKPFTADGWTLRFVNWVVENQIERPKRVDLARLTTQAGQVSLRIVVDEWTVP
jgi:outer membrane lipoprotein LolB